MKVSLSWLRDYVPFDMAVEDLAHMLTMAGLEVEAIENRYAYLNQVLVGRITAVEPHPNAQKLKLCRVQCAEHTYRVVCGAPNARVDLLAPLALPGAELPGGQAIAVSTIRGQESHGMLCSAGELGLEADRSGLMELDGGLQSGTPLNQALGLNDAVLEVSLTPNRPDCLSVMGIAREIAGFLGVRIQRPAIALPRAHGDIHALTSVRVEAPDHCPRYAACLLDQITVGPSPAWLQDRLTSVGLRPINNLVDITNFVMMETGQPLHAFNFDNLAENRIVVRTAHPGEPFTTLDGKSRTMEGDMLMICDGLKPVGIAGVMGGLNSEIEPTTRRVLIESAYFNPVSVRRTAKRLGLNTDASHRFERGVDPHGCLYALMRAAQLMAELGGGRLIGGTIDVQHNLPTPARLELNIAKANRVLGTDLAGETMAGLLRAIEFEVEPGDGHLKVTAPSFRVDVSRPEDLMEEVARRYGYDKIPVTYPGIPPTALVLPKMLLARQQVRSLLMGAGFTETINYSFIHKDSTDRLRLPREDERRATVAVLNPLSEDQAVMRSSLIPGLLETVQRNLAHQSRTLKLYETGKTFVHRAEGELPRETEMVAGVWTGDRRESGWYAKSEPCDFYDLKGVLEALLSGLKIQDVRFTQLPREQCNTTRPGVSARIELEGKTAGLIGELHPQVAKVYDLKQTLFIFELDMHVLLERMTGKVIARPLPRYPATFRDATLIVDKGLETGALVDQVLQEKHLLVESVKIFDLFEGRQIPAGKKSVSLRITYRSAEKTLEDETVNQLHKLIMDRLVDRYKADLPT